MNVHLFSSRDEPVSGQPFEYVERKGLGHPDAICDSVMQTAAEALRSEYSKRCGRVLHHNLDKALLVAGQSIPRLGGGRIVSPMKLFAGDRATTRFGDMSVPVDEIVESAITQWFRDHLRFVESDHLLFQSEIKPGSIELTDIFDRESPVANDTSAAVGFAPLSETERIVLETEHYINSDAFKKQFPVAGEDVKVMGVRDQRRLHLTIAIAMVDRYVSSKHRYFEQKEEIQQDVLANVAPRLCAIDELVVDINTLDDPDRGEAGMYLTVTGTSAESGDGGEVGRGNAVNGLISLSRPTSNEAAAGKNTSCHVGNIYNHLSHVIAAQVVETIQPVRESYVWMCSQIGQPVGEPLSTSVRLVLEDDVQAYEVADKVNTIVSERLHRLKSVS